jgi:hypothetical protein
MQIEPKNSRRARLTFTEAIEADALREDVSPHIGRLARLKYEFDTGQARQHDMYSNNDNPRSIKVSVPYGALPSIADSLITRYETSSDWQRSLVLGAHEAIAEFRAA